MDASVLNDLLNGSPKIGKTDDVPTPPQEKDATYYFTDAGHEVYASHLSKKYSLFNTYLAGLRRGDCKGKCLFPFLFLL